MDKLIPDREKELDAIAQRIVVMWIENPNLDIRGLLFSVKSRVNRVCGLVGEWSGDEGKLWKSDIEMCVWSHENGRCPHMEEKKQDGDGG